MEAEGYLIRFTAFNDKKNGFVITARFLDSDRGYVSYYCRHIKRLYVMTYGALKCINQLKTYLNATAPTSDEFS